MKGTTRERKNAIRRIEDRCGRQWVVEQMHQLLVKGKQGFDTCMGNAEDTIPNYYTCVMPRLIIPYDAHRIAGT